MARLRAPWRVALLTLVALLIALGATAPAFGAGSRDPRCEGWEAALTPPPGINIHELCPAGEVTTEAVNLDGEPLLPYVVGLVVMAVVLGVFGFIAVRMTAPRTERRRAGSVWWACPSCGVRNGPDRTSCFACHALHADAPTTPVDAADRDATAPAEEPHPA